METYILVMFILYILGIGVKLVQLNNNQYPRVEELTKNKDLFTLFLFTSFAIWTGYLIF